MAAAEYSPLAKYRSPLSRYFCLRTLGSREHPTRNMATKASTTKRRNVETFFMTFLCAPEFSAPQNLLSVLARSIGIDQRNKFSGKRNQPLLGGNGSFTAAERSDDSDQRSIATI